MMVNGMKITNKYGTVEFDWKDYKRPMLSFSGGADSTLLLWLSLNLLETKPDDVSLHVFTGVTPFKGKFKQFTSQENFDMMREEFSHLKDRVPDRRIMYNMTQEELGDEQIRLADQEGVYDLRMYALTANPPRAVMEQHDLIRDRVEERDIENKKNEWITHQRFHGPMYQPFINVDKRFIAQCYEDFNLWRFFNNTISCERLRETPDMINNEEPCGRCWWCREKKMAFGVLDGGLDDNSSMREVG